MKTDNFKISILEKLDIQVGHDQQLDADKSVFSILSISHFDSENQIVWVELRKHLLQLKNSLPACGVSKDTGVLEKNTYEPCA